MFNLHSMSYSFLYISRKIILNSKIVFKPGDLEKHQIVKKELPALLLPINFDIEPEEIFAMSTKEKNQASLLLS